MSEAIRHYVEVMKKLKPRSSRNIKDLCKEFSIEYPSDSSPEASVSSTSLPLQVASPDLPILRPSLYEKLAKLDETNKSGTTNKINSTNLSAKNKTNEEDSLKKLENSNNVNNSLGRRVSIKSKFFASTPFQSGKKEPWMVSPILRSRADSIDNAEKTPLQVPNDDTHFAQKEIKNKSIQKKLFDVEADKKENCHDTDNHVDNENLCTNRRQIKSTVFPFKVPVIKLKSTRTSKLLKSKKGKKREVKKILLKEIATNTSPVSDDTNSNDNERREFANSTSKERHNLKALGGRSFKIINQKDDIVILQGISPNDYGGLKNFVNGATLMETKFENSPEIESNDQTPKSKRGSGNKKILEDKEKHLNNDKLNKVKSIGTDPISVEAAVEIENQISYVLQMQETEDSETNEKVKKTFKNTPKRKSNSPPLVPETPCNEEINGDIRKSSISRNNSLVNITPKEIEDFVVGDNDLKTNQGENIIEAKNENKVSKIQSFENKQSHEDHEIDFNSYNCHADSEREADDEDENKNKRKKRTKKIAVKRKDFRQEQTLKSKRISGNKDLLEDKDTNLISDKLNKVESIGADLVSVEAAVEIENQISKVLQMQNTDDSESPEKVKKIATDAPKRISKARPLVADTPCNEEIIDDIRKSSISRNNSVVNVTSKEIDDFLLPEPKPQEKNTKKGKKMNDLNQQNEGISVNNNKRVLRTQQTNTQNGYSRQGGKRKISTSIRFASGKSKKTKISQSELNDMLKYFNCNEVYSLNVNNAGGNNAKRKAKPKKEEKGLQVKTKPKSVNENKSKKESTSLKNKKRLNEEQGKSKSSAIVIKENNESEQDSGAQKTRNKEAKKEKNKKPTIEAKEADLKDPKSKKTSHSSEDLHPVKENKGIKKGLEEENIRGLRKRIKATTTGEEKNNLNLKSGKDIDKSLEFNQESFIKSLVEEGMLCLDENEGNFENQADILSKGKEDLEIENQNNNNVKTEKESNNQKSSMKNTRTEEQPASMILKENKESEQDSGAPNTRNRVGKRAKNNKKAMIEVDEADLKDLKSKKTGLPSEDLHPVKERRGKKKGLEEDNKRCLRKRIKPTTTTEEENNVELKSRKAIDKSLEYNKVSFIKSLLEEGILCLDENEGYFDNEADNVSKAGKQDLELKNQTNNNMVKTEKGSKNQKTIMKNTSTEKQQASMEFKENNEFEQISGVPNTRSREAKKVKNNKKAMIEVDEANLKNPKSKILTSVSSDELGLHPVKEGIEKNRRGLRKTNKVTNSKKAKEPIVSVLEDIVVKSSEENNNLKSDKDTNLEAKVDFEDTSGYESAKNNLIEQSCPVLRLLKCHLKTLDLGGKDFLKLITNTLEPICDGVMIRNINSAYEFGVVQIDVGKEKPLARAGGDVEFKVYSGSVQFAIEAYPKIILNKHGLKVKVFSGQCYKITNVSQDVAIVVFTMGADAKACLF